MVLVGLFVAMYIVAMVKRPGSRYQDKPEEQNPMEGKMRHIGAMGEREQRPCRENERVMISSNSSRQHRNIMVPVGMGREQS